jgi:protein-S-isoprenylcysteine O-methyltransferase Ste14
MIRRSIFVNGLIVTAVGIGILLLYNRFNLGSENPQADQITDAVGIVIILFGQFLRASARGYKSQKHIEKDKLIINGPYALVRNPMYLASFLIGLGIVVVLLRWWMIPAYLLFFLMWYWPQIHNEQKWLVGKFGQQFTDYCSTTPCFFPRLQSLIKFRQKEHMPIKLKWLKREWNTILAWSVVVFAVEGYKDAKTYGNAACIKHLAVMLAIVFIFAFAVYAILKSIAGLKEITSGN